MNERNVEHVLNELRPMLKADGGDVKLVEIDGTVIKLELEGACSSCHASTTTMIMGIKKKLKETIPTITEVVQVFPDTPNLNPENINSLTDEFKS